MKRVSFLAVVVTLALAPAALAKGPVEASLAGPGLGTPLGFGGWDGSAADEARAPLMRFVEAAGFFPGAFAMTPDPMLDARPRGELGPRYVATYDLGSGPDGGENIVVQDVYPYAKPAPVTYMAPGQPFYGGRESRGGWFVAPALRDVLVAAGLPPTPPVDDGSRFPWPLVAALAGLTAALGICALAVGRLRQRSAIALASTGSRPAK
jgi:hypothetical protein